MHWGPGLERFARDWGFMRDCTRVRHQAFITRRLPMLGKNGDSLDMLIDRQEYKGFSAGLWATISPHGANYRLCIPAGGCVADG